MHNYSSMVAIVSGLNSPPIRRLKRSWEQVNARHMGQLGNCEFTIDSGKNFNNYRSTLAKVVPPCVPFIGELSIFIFLLLDIHSRLKVSSLQHWPSSKLEAKTLCQATWWTSENDRKRRRWSKIFSAGRHSCIISVLYQACRLTSRNHLLGSASRLM